MCLRGTLEVVPLVFVVESRQSASQAAFVPAGTARHRMAVVAPFHIRKNTKCCYKMHQIFTYNEEKDVGILGIVAHEVWTKSEATAKLERCDCYFTFLPLKS